MLTSKTPEGHTTTYQYDLANRLAQIIDPETNTTQYQYDETGRPQALVDGNGDTPATYTYTPNGLLATVMDAGNNVTSYTYDGYDRLERITHPDSTFEGLVWDDAGRSDLPNHPGRTDHYPRIRRSGQDGFKDRPWPVGYPDL